MERLQAREFILLFNDKASLEEDPFFNKFDPDYVDPVWKTTIKRLIGWQKNETNITALIEESIIYNYRKSISVKSTDSGAISISVKHQDPNRAAEYANILMKEVRVLVQAEKCRGARI